jgi:hypothetical protein
MQAGVCNVLGGSLKQLPATEMAELNDLPRCEQAVFIYHDSTGEEQRDELQKTIMLKHNKSNSRGES